VQQWFLGFVSLVEMEVLVALAMTLVVVGCSGDNIGGGGGGGSIWFLVAAASG
jgi:hypothetical protein